MPKVSKTETAKVATPKVKRAPKDEAPLYPTYNDQNVRWDGNAGKWARLDDQMNPHQKDGHFNFGILEDVEFTVHQTREVSGCAASTNTIGVAKAGRLRMNDQGGRLDGVKNLSFDGSCFLDAQTGDQIHKAKVVRLMPNRTAVYVPAED